MNTLEIAFRQGFAERLASKGVSPGDVSDALDHSFSKQAGWKDYSGFLKDTGKAVVGMEKAVIGAGLVGPAVLAGIAGYLIERGRGGATQADIDARNQTAVVRELESQKRKIEARRAGSAV